MNVTTNMSVSRTNQVLQKVREILPEIVARGDEIEAKGRVPLDLLDKVTQTGAFRMCLPDCFGGEALSLREACQVIEEIAMADASVAWHLMVAAGSQIIGARLPRASLDVFYADGGDVWPKGAYSPKGMAVPVEGGYRLSGRWPLASGARNFDWVGLGFMVMGERGPLMSADGKMPDMRVCMVPKAGVEVIETWDAVGLRGTRSDDLACKDLFVPEEWQASFFGPSTVPEAPIIGMSMPFATGTQHNAIVIGTLRAAIAELAEAALTRKPAFNPTALMKDDPVFRTRFGEIAARVETLRAAADFSITKTQASIDEFGDVTPVLGAELMATQSLIHHEGTSLMDQRQHLYEQPRPTPLARSALCSTAPVRLDRQLFNLRLRSGRSGSHKDRRAGAG
jgi:alkylation response protein AidB-like acyl-CoA dehydrogenase